MERSAKFDCLCANHDTFPVGRRLKTQFAILRTHAGEISVHSTPIMTNTLHDIQSEKQPIQPAQGSQQKRVAVGLRISILIFLLVLLATPILVPILIGQNTPDDTGRRGEDQHTTID